MGRSKGRRIGNPAARAQATEEPAQWTPEDKIETHQLREDWQLWVEAEAVIAAVRIMARKDG